MPTVPDIPTIIQVAVIAQYLSSRATASKNFYNNQPVDKRNTELIYLTRKDVQWAYTTNPADPTLIKTGEYLFSLCAPFSQEALRIIAQSGITVPVVTGPASLSVNVGIDAVFSVAVTGTGPFTYAWYKNGVLIPGVVSSSYTLADAQLTDSGDTFFARVTNAAGTTVSGTATLTVTALITGQYYFGDTDYSSDLLAGTDDVPYSGTFPITHNSPLSVQFPSGAANNKYIVVKYPVSESVKTIYASPPIDSGNIPSIAFENVITIGGFRYIFSRTGNPFSQNTLAPVIFS